MIRAIRLTSSFFVSAFLLFLALGVATSWSVARADEPLGPGCQNSCCCDTNCSIPGPNQCTYQCINEIRPDDCLDCACNGVLGCECI
ncbi:MAG TPA: hypothetical protein VG406_13005 [Isosphaeraceae bacterium]|jgi:hypothetical protein|nr:hypothetical protein [Isosphaeraceae bacterium]